MKRFLTLFVFLLSFVVNAIAEPIHNIEVTPLERAPLLKLADFRSAEVSGAGDEAVLGVKLTDSATLRMKNYTKKNVGHDLPFVVDGKVIATPTLRVPITGNALQVGPLKKAQAEELAKAINDQALK